MIATFGSRILIAVAIVSLTMPVTAFAESPAGKLEVRVTDHKPGIDQFSSLNVTLKAVALHEKGQGRRLGWEEVTGPSPAIDIVPLKDGRYESLGSVNVPVGTYDAVAVRFAAVDGQLKVESVPTIWLEDAVVRIDLAITEQANAPLVVDLYAEDQTEHDPPRYVVKVKEVRLGE